MKVRHHGDGGEDDPVKERENPGETGENLRQGHHS